MGDDVMPAEDCRPDWDQFRPLVAGSRTLVTGGAGFIGSHLVRRLLALGSEVVVIDDLTTGYRSNLPASGVELVEASILDASALRSAMTGCRFVFHKAAMASVPESVAEPERCVAINVEGTRQVAQAAADAGAQRVVFASSAAVYGDDPSLPSRESDALQFNSPYAESKAAGEEVLESLARSGRISTVSLRYFNIFGPRQDPRSAYAAAIAAFLDALAHGRRPIVFGDGQQTRDFCPVDNVVWANLRAAACPAALAGERLNIGTGRSVTLLEVVERIAAALGVPGDFDFGPPRAGDVRHSASDITAARQVIGYEPIASFEQGIDRLVAATVDAVRSEASNSLPRFA